MSLKYFPGIEHTWAYAGNVFQAIHPSAFPGDPIIAAERSLWEKPFQLSLFYLGPRIMGEIWLDDRFVFVVYLALVVVSLVGIDRMVKLAGITDFVSRLVIQLIFMRDHQYLTKMVTFSSQPDVHHGAFAIPAIIWLIYAAVSRKPLWLILGLCVLTASISIKLAPYPIAYCLIIAAVNGGIRDRVVVVSVFAAALAVFAYVAAYAIPVPETERLLMWNLMSAVEMHDANPFYPSPDMATTIVKNIVFVVILTAALLAPVPRSAATRGMKIYIGLGLLTWLAGSLYFSFAPDALKIVHVLPFSLGRSLSWPLTVAYLVVMASVILWLRNHKSARDVVAATLVFMGLLVVGPGNYGLWAGLFSASILVVLATQFFRQRTAGDPDVGPNPFPWIADRYPVLLVQALALTIAIAFASTILKKLPEWKTWAIHGVHGGSSGAQWIGIDEYIRENTPFDAVVLPLYEATPGTGLISTRALASRGGRTIPYLTIYSSPFDLQKWKVETEQIALMERFQDATRERDWRQAAKELEGLFLQPDYLILKKNFLSKEFFTFFPYAEETRIRDYVILKRKTPLK